jgi:hypothetical protein
MVAINFSHLITKNESKSVVNIITEKFEKKNIGYVLGGDNLQETITKPQDRFIGGVFQIALNNYVLSGDN